MLIIRNVILLFGVGFALGGVSADSHAAEKSEAALARVTRAPFPPMGVGAVYKGTRLFLNPTTRVTYALSLWQPLAAAQFFDVLLVSLPDICRAPASNFSRSRFNHSLPEGLLTRSC